MVWCLPMASRIRNDEQLPWYRRGSHRWTPFRDVPWKRLWLFMTAVFLLFSVNGFFIDLVSGAREPYAIVIASAIAWGLDAALSILIVTRLPRWMLVVLIALQFVLIRLLDWLSLWMPAAFHVSRVSPDAGMKFAASGILAVVVLSYAFFLRFFRVEGQASMRVRRELELAHGIQATLVPPIALGTARWQIYGISRPSEKVGGDLVDVVRLDGGDTVAYLADIAGHGLPAGILMGMLKTAVRTALRETEASAAESTLPRLLEKLNRVLPEVKEPQMYATLTAFRLSEDGTVWYSMAASPPILHWRATGPQRLEESQFPLGLLPVGQFTGNRMEVAPGDVLAVATDGILEVCDRQGLEYGVDGVERVMARQARETLESMAAAILSDVQSFGPQVDDQTLLLMRRLA